MHFFQDAWHLKDWIRHDPNSSIGKAIEQHIERYPPLNVLADIANGCKHLVRTRSDRTGAYVTSTDVTVHLARRRPVEVTLYIELADGSKVTAGQWVEQSAAAWNRMLVDIG